MTAQIVSPLEAAKKKYSAEKNRLSNEIASLKKEMQRRTSVLNEKKNAYWKSCEVHHREKNRLEGAPEAKLQKLQVIYQKAKAEMDQAEKDYRDNIDEFNAFKAEYEVSMKCFLNEYQRSDFERAVTLEDVLQKYAEHTEINCRELTEFFNAFHEQLASLSPSKDIHEFLAPVQSAIPPEPDQYEEYETEAVRNSKEPGADGGMEEVQIGSCALPKIELPATCYLLKYAVALFNFTGTEQNELSFKRGDLLIVLQEHDSGWWVGELFGRQGLFPASYVEVLPNRATPPKRWPPSGIQSCTTRCSFDSRDDPDLLPFDEGETLVITGEFEDWFVGENSLGVIGMFPKEVVLLNDVKH